jgi:tetratricopeptide (TPR) repeat protein
MGAGNVLLAAFEAVVEDEPDNIYARFNLATLLAADGCHERALVHLEKVNALVPGYEGGAAWYARGLSLLALRRFTDAIAAFERVLRIPYTGRCSHALAHLNQAVALDKLGRRDEARAARARADEVGNREGLEWLNEGNGHLLAGRLEEALTAYDRSIAYPWKGRPMALLQRGLGRKSQGKLNEALADLKAALLEAEGADPAELQLILGVFDHGGPTEALRSLDRVVGTMIDALTYYNRAFVRARLGNLPGAAEDLRAALALVPELAREAKTDADFAPLRAAPEYAHMFSSDASSR